MPIQRAATALAIALIAVGCGSPEANTNSTMNDSPTTPQTNEELVALGAELHETIGCATCHSLDGRRRTAGTYKGIYGTEVELADGRTLVRDDAYLRRSIVDADAELVRGYQDVMPDYAETLGETEIEALIRLIESVGPES